MTALAPADSNRSQFQVTQITGRLVSDPSLRYLPDGTPVCSMRLAVDRMGRGDSPGYIDVSTFRRPAEACAKILTRGWLVAVEGRLEYSQWESDSGKRSAIRLVGHVEFLAAPRDHDNEQADDDAADAAQAAARDVESEPAPAKGRRKRTPAAVAATDDDIPF